MFQFHHMFCSSGLKLETDTVCSAGVGFRGYNGIGASI